MQCFLIILPVFAFVFRAAAARNKLDDFGISRGGNTKFDMVDPSTLSPHGGKSDTAELVFPRFNEHAIYGFGLTARSIMAPAGDGRVLKRSESKVRGSSAQGRLRRRGPPQGSVQGSEQTPRKGSRNGQSSKPLPQLGPDIAKDVLVRAGKHLKKQQGEAQKAYWDTIGGWQRTGATPEKKEFVEKKDKEIHEKGKDIEHIGMMNKYLHKKMKKEFPPLKNDLVKYEREQFNTKKRKEEMRKRGEERHKKAVEDARRLKAQQATELKGLGGLKGAFAHNKGFLDRRPKSVKSVQSGGNGRVAQSGKAGNGGRKVDASKTAKTPAKTTQNQPKTIRDRLTSLFRKPSREGSKGS